MFEFIKLEDIKSLCSHVVENYGKILEDVEYVQTFKALKTRYDQHQDKLKERDRGISVNFKTFLKLFILLFKNIFRVKNTQVLKSTLKRKII